ncbi:hypothetical protein FP803_00285 [Candidatus Woesearchaeota archaeon]|nr:hypothetical protein [Candidatus Woesearchaeota archaeon]
MEEKRAKLMRIFANIPEKVRSEDIIAVVDNKPYTWNSAMIEVKNNSKIGKEIIKKLEKLGAI